VPFHEAGPESVAVLGRRAHLDADEVGRAPVASRRRGETQLLGFLRNRTNGHLERSGRLLFRSSRD